ncbi:MAG: DUF3833 domain-containing protein [Gammaproteobacteria bacterium]|nr:DUF3833 domain-containing protein [Gammaproteobacteria bacterium]
MSNKPGNTCVQKKPISSNLLYLGLLTIFCLIGVSACSAKITDYKNSEPVLDLQKYFQGELIAWGIFQSRSGEVKRHFKVNMTAVWKGNICTLEENFLFDDGEQQQRTWTITKLDAHRYSGVAGDVIGEAVGVSYGNALNWRYVLELQVDGKRYKVNFDDWMYLISDDTLINRARVTKFGFRVADVTLFFKRK